MKEVILSSIITVHNEGLKVHKSLLSIQNSLKRISHKYSYEIIIHVDNGDEATRCYLEKYKNDRNIRLLYNTFSDPGLSRNFSAKQAKGKFIAFLDGDDLISDNWFIEGLKLLEEDPKMIIHPEAVLTFGINQPNVLSIQKDSFGIDKDRLILAGENRWGSVILLNRELFLSNQYKELNNGYSHEDYVFNVETVSKGIIHKVAKGTVLFYRRSSNSRLSSSNDDHAVIPYLELFDFFEIKKLISHEKIKSSSILDRMISHGYKLYKGIRNNDFLNFFITPVAKLTLKVLRRQKQASDSAVIPPFVFEEWVKINKVETQLYPYPDLKKSIQLYSAENQVSVGNAFLEVAQSVNHYPDYIFIVPWVVRGGSDKVLFNTIKAIKELYPHWKITVIATLKAKNSWAASLPEDVDFIDFGRISNGLPPHMQSNLFSRIIMQLKCNKMHIINSEFGYRWAMSHKKLLRNQFTLNVSLFASEFIKSSNMSAKYSYDDPFIFELYDVIDRIFTDNRNVIIESTEKNGFDKSKFSIHYQPVDIKSIKKKKIRSDSGDQRFKIMWAGRIVNVKLPEVVKKIGEKLDSREFSIDVYGEFSDEISKNIFNNNPTIKYCGGFDHFSKLPVDKYDLFLYTSLTDGMPNTLLEATASGLPIIASNDGGVCEFVKDKKTGILVDDPLDVDSYVKEIKYISKRKEELNQYLKNAQKLLAKRHSWNSFIIKVKEDFDKYE